MSREPDAPSVGNMEFVLDFEEDLGINFDINNGTKLAIGNAIADQIRKRSREEQRPFEGSTFAPYSEKYAKKKGVEVTDVDLTLFEDMLNSVSVTDIGHKTVTIGFDSTKELPKAFNHHTGDTVPARPFFGIEVGELEIIKASIQTRLKVDEETREVTRRQDAALKRAEDAAIKELVEQIAGELFDFG